MQTCSLLRLSCMLNLKGFLKWTLVSKVMSQDETYNCYSCKRRLVIEWPAPISNVCCFALSKARYRGWRRDKSDSLVKDLSSWLLQLQEQNRWLFVEAFCFVGLCIGGADDKSVGCRRSSAGLQTSPCCALIPALSPPGKSLCLYVSLSVNGRVGSTAKTAISRIQGEANTVYTCLSCCQLPVLSNFRMAKWMVWQIQQESWGTPSFTRVLCHALTSSPSP